MDKENVDSEHNKGKKVQKNLKSNPKPIVTPALRK